MFPHLQDGGSSLPPYRCCSGTELQYASMYLHLREEMKLSKCVWIFWCDVLAPSTQKGAWRCGLSRGDAVHLSGTKNKFGSVFERFKDDEFTKETHRSRTVNQFNVLLRQFESSKASFAECIQWNATVECELGCRQSGLYNFQATVGLMSHYGL
jgi:hypothetical protein